MKSLIVDDDFTCRLLLHEILKIYGPAHIAVNGAEAVQAVHAALETKDPYQLICLDIMMPGMDGQATLKEIRALEEAAGVGFGLRTKVIMTTALSDVTSVMTAFGGLCDAYLVKPIQKAKLLEELRKLQRIT